MTRASSRSVAQLTGRNRHTSDTTPGHQRTARCYSERLRMKSFHPFRLDVANQCLWRGDTRVALMPKPFAVLQYLVEHPGRLVTHDQLLGASGPTTYVQPEVLRRYILEIRRALGDRAEAPQFVRTFPKRGYQFIAPVVEDSR